MARVLLVAACVLAMVGCSEGDSLEGASTDPAVGVATNTETALLTSIDVTSVDGHDRVTFEFANDVPGYDIRYVERPIVADGSGEEIDVQGSDVLQARFEPALDADLTKEDAPRTYYGPARFSPKDADTVVELVRTGGFEAVLTWAIGMKQKAPFKVSTLDDPPRVVVDIDG
jgi:hypothetical protein